MDGGFVLKPPVDAITEFRILTHNSNAEFGNSLGSTTNISTRSGSNAIHGALWEFLRNDAFDATNFFAKTTEPLKQNQFGATIGGPIRKNKTFFFGFYEGFRNRQGETQGSTVPSLLERQGNFSEMCQSGFDPATGVCNDRQDPNDPKSPPIHQLYNLFANHAPVPFKQLPFINPFSLSQIPLPAS